MKRLYRIPDVLFLFSEKYGERFDGREWKKRADKVAELVRIRGELVKGKGYFLSERSLENIFDIVSKIETIRMIPKIDIPPKWLDVIPEDQGEWILEAIEQRMIREGIVFD